MFPCAFSIHFLKGDFMRTNKSVLKLTVSALCLALAYTLPFLTGQIPEIGSMLLPMHIPVLLCGFLCGWKWGLGVGFIAPLFRSLTLGIPPLFPTAFSMAFELATYGFICGIMHRFLPKKRAYIYVSLLISMALGRIVWGIVMAICMGADGGAFTFSAFILASVTNAIPGLAIQIVLVPILVIILDNKKVLNIND